MIEARVLHGSQGGVQVLRFIGDIRYPICPSVTEYLASLYATGEVEGFVVDLTETVSIDSTNLGMLARIANRMREQGGRRVIIVSDRPCINEVLTSMGFREVFDLVESTPFGDEPATTTLDLEPSSEEELARVMLEAHRTLMECGGNGEQFRDVVTLLEKEVQKP